MSGQATRQPLTPGRGGSRAVAPVPEVEPIPYPFIGNSARVKAVLDLVDLVADTDATVLIHGESGTGKELIARRLHAGSSRREGPFVAVNCGAVTESLLDAEMFGHTRGAFTGADKARVGRFEAAHRGTIFLDELAEMGQMFQVVLLRVLQTGEYTPVGSSECRFCDVRVVAATNGDLGPLIESKRFRDDLYYRLNIIRIDLLPLRERREDIPLLVDHFLDVYCRRYDRKACGVSAGVYEALARYDFPGNVRELENMMHRAVVLSGGGMIEVKDLTPEVVTRGAAADVSAAGGYHFARRGALRAFEEAYLRAALCDCGGIVSRAARQTGLSERNFHKKMVQYKLNYRTFRQ